jgi:anti-sigma B factor antagonist
MHSGIYAGRSQSDVWVRVDGKGSHQNSPELKAFITQEVAPEAGGQRVIVDLSSCDGMDSTFMGVLTCIAGRLEESGGSLHVINAYGRNGELLRGLGLDHLFSIHDREGGFTFGSTPDVASVAKSDYSKRDRSSVCLEAHEALARVDDRNASAFRDVIDIMRRRTAEPQPG